MWVILCKKMGRDFYIFAGLLEIFKTSLAGDITYDWQVLVWLKP